MTDPDHRRLLEAESRLLGSVAADDLTVEVPHIEGWTLHKLIGHAGWVMRYVTAVLTSPPDAPPRRSSIAEPPLGPDVLAWYDDARSELLAAFDTADPEATVTTFTGPQPSRWWLRRLSHELAMHRWDAQAARGPADPIDPDLARDGIDEVFEVFVPVRMDLDRLGGTGETLHLHATDTDGEWLCTLGAEAVTWSHGHAKADVAARGPVSDLLLVLWGRIPPSRVEVFGDASILDRWQRAAAF